jgi:hypothetical protein
VEQVQVLIRQGLVAFAHAARCDERLPENPLVPSRSARESATMMSKVYAVIARHRVIRRSMNAEKSASTR